MKDEPDKPIQLYVIDSSAMLSRLLPDELDPQIEQIFIQFANTEQSLLAPELLKFEVLNGLRSAYVRKRIKEIEIMAIFEIFIQFPISYTSSDWNDVTKIALMYNLSIYDSTYVSLAHKHRAKLLTLDQKLQSVTTTN